MSSTPTAAELYRWGARDEKRRRAARGVAGLFSPPVISLLAAGLVGALVASSDAGGGVRLALAAIATANIVAVFGTSYRMYWRSDSALLARLPISGGVLFRLAMMRSLRATAVALPPSIAGPIALVAAGAPVDVAVRLGVVAAASALMAALLAPAACLAAGGMVASDKAQAVLDSFGGEFRAPRVGWLGTLPGLVATAVALLPIAGAGWVRLETQLVDTPLILAGIAAGVSVLSLWWALGAADRILILAQREIAALDQERLAHIEKSTAGPLERLWGALFAGGARPVYFKDAALMRRRYPAPYAVAFLGIVVAWITAATGESGTAVAIVFSLAAYALIMARRLAIEPVEYPRLLRTLPLMPGAALRAKRAAALLRALFWTGVPGAALIVYSDNLPISIALAGSALAIATFGGALLVSGER